MTEVKRTIPVTLYIRPNGGRTRDELLVSEEYASDEEWAKVEENLVLFGKYGITVTAEEVGGHQINVCLDDGDFDYKFELFPGNDKLITGIVGLVRDFDEQDYLKAKEMQDG